MGQRRPFARQGNPSVTRMESVFPACRATNKDPGKITCYGLCTHGNTENGFDGLPVYGEKPGEAGPPRDFGRLGSGIPSRVSDFGKARGGADVS